LAEVAGVEAKNMGALRARLRHLRNIGLPRLPQTGSGQPIAYSRRQVLEMMIALELEKVGHAPKSAALLAGSIVRMSPDGQHEGEDCYIVVVKGKPSYQMVHGWNGFMEIMRPAPDVFSVINVSGFVRKLDPALDRALAAG
jgi:hypothetical protein